MKRKGVHNTLLILATLAFAVCCLWQTVVSRDIAGVLWVCGVYAAFLGTFYIVAFITLPGSLRKAPDLPAEFTGFRLGKLSPETSAKLETFALENQDIFSGTIHTLHRAERQFPQGTWICEIETADGAIIAISRRFESATSQFFDSGKELGAGCFIVFHTTSG